jgi:hypothetical protein
LGEDGKAKQMGVVYTRSRFGERLKVGSYEEYIYLTEYDPPKIPGKVTLTGTGKGRQAASTVHSFAELECRIFGTA